MYLLLFVMFGREIEGEQKKKKRKRRRKERSKHTHLGTAFGFAGRIVRLPLGCHFSVISLFFFFFSHLLLLLLLVKLIKVNPAALPSSISHSLGTSFKKEKEIAAVAAATTVAREGRGRGEFIGFSGDEDE